MENESEINKEKAKTQLKMEIGNVFRECPYISSYIQKEMQEPFIMDTGKPIIVEKKLLGYEESLAMTRDLFYAGDEDANIRVGQVLHETVKMLNIKKRGKKLIEKVQAWNEANNPDLVKNGTFAIEGDGLYRGFYTGFVIMSNQRRLEEIIKFKIGIGMAVFNALENGLSPEEIIDLLDEKQEVANAFGISVEETMKRASKNELDPDKLDELFQKRRYDALVPSIGSSIRIYPAKEYTED